LFCGLGKFRARFLHSGCASIPKSVTELALGRPGSRSSLPGLTQNKCPRAVFGPAFLLRGECGRGQKRYLSGPLLLGGSPAPPHAPQQARERPTNQRACLGAAQCRTPPKMACNGRQDTRKPPNGWHMLSPRPCRPATTSPRLSVPMCGMLNFDYFAP
jgi:hypothetical protein